MSKINKAISNVTRKSKGTVSSIPEKIKETSYPVKYDVFTDNDFVVDCPNSEFIPTVLPKADRVIAIGDIHGDFSLAQRSFIIAGLIDENQNWIAKPPNTIVVQVGDQIDSCRPVPGVYDCHSKRQDDDANEDVKIMKFFDEMHEKAKAHGGAVYSLLGNHELMNSEGEFKYVSYENYNNFEYVDPTTGKKYIGPSGRKKAFEPGGPIAKTLACNRLSVLIIGSNMFVHAGVLPVLAQRLKHLNLDPQTKLKYLNKIVRKWLLNKLASSQESNDKHLFVNSSVSPFWTRILGVIPKNKKINSPECENYVKSTLEVYQVGHIIVGHTPTLFTHNEGIHGTCYEGVGNRLFRVDGGFSRAFRIFETHDIVQVMEIINDDEFNIITYYGPPADVFTPIKKPDIGITEHEMKEVSSIYSQNRISGDKKKNSNDKKKKTTKQ